MHAPARRPLTLVLGALAMLALGIGGCSPGGGAASQPQFSPNVSDAALAAGQPQVALHVADLVLARQPDDPAALTARGNALYALGQMDAARDAYRAAIKHDANDASALLGLGRSLLRTDPKAAETALLAVTRLQPNNAIAFNDLGVARDLLKDHAGAQDAYREALALNPDSTKARMNLGLSLALSGHAAQAVAMLRPLDPDAGARPIWRANLAVALALNGDTPGARNILRSEPEVAQPQATAASVAQPRATAASEAQPRATASQLARPRAAAVSVAQPPPAASLAAQSQTAGLGAWIQLASVPSEQDVAPEWQRLQARFAALRGKALTVETGQVNGQTWWRLRIGSFADLADAEAACRPLLAAGAACLPIAPPQI